MAIQQLNTFAQIQAMDSILTKDYTYDLPNERIAQYPLAERDQSRLLVYKNHTIQHSRFFELTKYLPTGATLFFNNTKVIPARLLFQKATGASIEIFLLNPVQPSSLLQLAMSATAKNQWHCTIGNLKRWTDAPLAINNNGVELKATLIDRAAGIVEFEWTPDTLSFAEVISLLGHVPLPPYLNRKDEPSDKQNYQTVYSKQEGAVAAPTAGLHFTDQILSELKQARYALEYLTLHVSAGTFQPIKVEDATQHTMHQEQVVVTRENLEALIKSTFTVAVGTTSLRTLESLYWYGIKLRKDPNAPFIITQHDAYTMEANLSLTESLSEILHLLKRLDNNYIVGETAIYARPGYQFKSVDALITNFHQPASTLILLIAAFVGPDWRNIYTEALLNDYRFLSYGDSSLLFKPK